MVLLSSLTLKHIDVDTKIMILCQIKLEILSKVDFHGFHTFIVFTITVHAGGATCAVMAHMSLKMFTLKCFKRFLHTPFIIFNTMVYGDTGRHELYLRSNISTSLDRHELYLRSNISTSLEIS